MDRPESSSWGRAHVLQGQRQEGEGIIHVHRYASAAVVHFVGLVYNIVLVSAFVLCLNDRTDE